MIVKSILLFELRREEDFGPDPGEVNRWLFNYDQRAQYGKGTVLRAGGGKWEWATRTTPDRLEYHFRILIPVRFRHVEGFEFVQPFYVSSGSATPDLSPRGTVWPTSGCYTQAYCQYRGHAPKYEGHLGKHFYSPKSGEWINHLKEVDRLPPQLVEVAEAIRARFGY